MQAEPDWKPLIDTPPHPEYPSGHASDCYTGTGILPAVFRDVSGPVTYVAKTGVPQGEAAATGMGPHIQPGSAVVQERVFRGFADIAAECADSRIWAGAHFRSANEGSRRLSATIVRRALLAGPLLQ